jgi:hypothetical protein
MANQTATMTPLEDILQPDGPYAEMFLMDDENPHGVIGHVCNQCGADVREVPCPEHAPREVPGLTLVACDAEPRHWLWVLAGDCYGPPCWRCESDRFWQADMDRRDAPHLRRRHGYRRTAAWTWLVRLGHRVGLLTGQYWRTCPGGGWCSGGHWRWTR